LPHDTSPQGHVTAVASVNNVAEVANVTEVASVTQVTIPYTSDNVAGGTRSPYTAPYDDDECPF